MPNKTSKYSNAVKQTSAGDLATSNHDVTDNHTVGLAYEKPVLIHYGDVRDITLGPTVGLGESGNELGRRNPP